MDSLKAVQEKQVTEPGEFLSVLCVLGREGTCATLKSVKQELGYPVNATSDEN